MGIMSFSYLTLPELYHDLGNMPILIAPSIQTGNHHKITRYETMTNLEKAQKLLSDLSIDTRVLTSYADTTHYAIKQGALAQFQLQQFTALIYDISDKLNNHIEEVAMLLGEYEEQIEKGGYETELEELEKGAKKLVWPLN